MQDSTSMILDKICLHIFKDCGIAYIIIDNFEKITLCGGNFEDLNLPVPEKNTHISDSVIFMEGLLPLEVESMEFSCIKMPSGSSIDAFLFKIENGYALIMWDASKKDAFLSQTQQKYNELSLLIEKQKNCIIDFSDKNSLNKNDIVLEDLCRALNLTVFEMNDKGSFVLAGKTPLWVEKIPHLKKIFSECECREDNLSFMGNFINEVKSRWRKNNLETFNSGIWIEKDDKGRDFLLEATAVNVNKKKLLMISHDVCHPNKTQSIIQKGRELALDYHNLQRSGQELKSINDELELRVKERTKQLEKTNKQLAEELEERKKIEKQRQEISRQLRQSQKMEAIGTLTGGIAHDFNNILSGIIGFTELAMLDVQDDPQLKHKLANILRGSDRAKALIRQILTFSHADEYEKKPLKLKLVAEEALNLIRASVPSNIDIKKKLQSKGYILADMSQIHQVVMNLCTNAWYAMQEKGGTLVVELDDVDIKPGDLMSEYELNSGRYLVLTVKDTGCGIPPDVIEKIFDPYFTTKEQDKGTGLGLSVVHGIVKNCNGCIKVDSKMGEGSVFKVYFPAFEMQTKSETKESPMLFGNKETILFVDDEPFQTEMATLMLPKLGYNVVTCNDSVKALDMFLEGKEKFDLLVTDMVMPKMSGVTLAEKIYDIRPDIPVVLCSGGIDDWNPDVIKKCGIKEYLIKPVSMKDLAQAVKSALIKKA